LLRKNRPQLSLLSADKREIDLSLHRVKTLLGLFNRPFGSINCDLAEWFEGGFEIIDASITRQDMKTSSVIALVKN